MEQEAEATAETETEQNQEAPDQEAPDTGLQKPQPATLPGPARWLGARGGYSPDALVSLQVAYERFEVSRPDPTVRSQEVIEVRIHGVGGASAESNLEVPTTLMVSGDKKAGFYRAWYPGQSSKGTPLREAYCWGKFSYATITSAAWLLLLPFALVNLASWALPSPHREGKDLELREWRGSRRFSRVLLRLLGLTFTAAFTITVSFLLVVIVARQAAYQKELPGWLGWYEDLTSSDREAIALVIVVVIIAGLRLFSGVTTGRYENWSPGDVGAPVDPTDPTVQKMRLSEPDMWKGSDSVRRQRFCHVLTACAIILTFAAIAFGEDSWQRSGGTFVAGLMVLFAVVVLMLPGCDRLWIPRRTDETTDDPGAAPPAGQPEQPEQLRLARRLARWLSSRSWALPALWQAILEALTWAGTLAAVVCVWLSGPDLHSGGYALEDALLHAPVLTEFGLLIALFLVLVRQKPWNQVDVFAWGFLSVLVAGLAVGVCSIFGGALLLTVTNVLSSASLDDAPDAEKIFVPGVVASGSIAFVVTIVSAVAVAAVLFVWRAKLKKKLIKGPEVTPTSDWKARDWPVWQEYRDKNLPYGGEDYEKAIKKVAGIWSLSRITDRAAFLGGGIAIPTLVVLFTAEMFALANSSALADRLGVAQFGSAATVAATLAFIGFLRTAMVSEAQRRKFAFFWDVVNFWPRAAHPFAPPCYAERVVPEVTTRIRRIVGDHERGDKDPAVGQVASERAQMAGSRVGDDGFEPHRPVVLNGYSQGSPISVAVMAQLPGQSHERVALLTLACPAHRLYGRAFPLYFGPDQLEAMYNGRLGGAGEDPRWINLCRRSDYVGGKVVVPDVDKWILDPPALWPISNPTRVPAHLHSDWFPDPQTHPEVDVLAERLPRLPDLDDVDAFSAAATAVPGFAGVELLMATGQLVIWSTEPLPEEVRASPGVAVEGLEVVWRQALYSRAELVAEVNRVLGAHPEGFLTGGGPRVDGQGVVFTTTDAVLLEADDPAGMLGCWYPTQVACEGIADPASP